MAFETREQTQLFRYVLLVAVLAFSNRTLPTPFLPLVITASWGFDQTSTVAGLVIATYPLAALVATPASSWLARSVRRNIWLHSIALIIMSVATAMFSLCMLLRDYFGNERALYFVLTLRMAQGISAALYLSANTTLVTRRFAENVPYVVGMTEVAVGIGSQLGRLIGGLLYDQGGFACPFLTIAALQFVVALGGFGFADKDSSNESLGGVELDHTPSRKDTSFFWSTLFTFRSSLALTGVLMNFLQRGFYDTTLPGHFEEHLGPLSITVLSAALSLRSVVYLIVSFFIARIMHSNAVGYEQILAVGVFSCVIGLSYMAMQAFFEAGFAALSFQESPPIALVWAGQFLSLACTSLADAALFVPSLPLMQREVKHLGNEAVEQASSLFIAFMTAGEGSGPIIGGWLVGQLGFRLSAALFAVGFIPLLCCLMLIACSRSGDTNTDLGQGFLDKETIATNMHDGDCAFAWRRIPFAQKAERLCLRTDRMYSDPPLAALRPLDPIERLRARSY